MKLSATTTSSSIVDLINDDEVLTLIEAKRNANEPIEIEISVWSWDSIFVETIDDEASTTDSYEVTSTFRFKTYQLDQVFVIASDSTDFNIQIVW